MRFFHLTFARIEIVQWGWSQWVFLADTHRLVCITQPSLPGLLRDVTRLWPKVKFWPWLFKVNTYIFLRLSARGKRWRLNCLNGFLTWEGGGGRASSHPPDRSESLVEQAQRGFGTESNVMTTQPECDRDTENIGHYTSMYVQERQPTAGGHQRIWNQQQ